MCQQALPQGAENRIRTTVRMSQRKLLIAKRPFEAHPRIRPDSSGWAIESEAVCRKIGLIVPNHVGRFSHTGLDKYGGTLKILYGRMDEKNNRPSLRKWMQALSRPTSQ